MRRRLLAGSLVGFVVVLLGFVGDSAGGASGAPPRPKRVDAPASVPDGFQSRSSRNAAVRKHLTALPTWTGSFVSGGVTYPYTMVGTDPAAGSARTAPFRYRSCRCVSAFDDGGAPRRHGHAARRRAFAGLQKGRSVPERSLAVWRCDAAGELLGFGAVEEPRLPRPARRAEDPSNAFARGAGRVRLRFRRRTVRPVSSRPAIRFSLAPQLSNYYDPASLLIIVVKDVEGDSFLGFHFALTPPGRTVPLTLIFTGYFTPNVVVGPEHRTRTYSRTKWRNGSTTPTPTTRSHRGVIRRRAPASTTCSKSPIPSSSCRRRASRCPHQRHDLSRHRCRWNLMVRDDVP